MQEMDAPKEGSNQFVICDAFVVVVIEWCTAVTASIDAVSCINNNSYNKVCQQNVRNAGAITSNRSPAIYSQSTESG